MKRLPALIAVLMIVIAAAGWMTSCKSGSDEPISSGEMEDILYDFHLSIGMIATENITDAKDRAYKEKLYKLSVLKKYGVTEQQFDESMVYYMRHADEMQDIYKSLAKRIGNEASKIGASVADLSTENSLSLSGDTANIWPLERGVVLMQAMPYNVKSFSVKADSAFHKGDRFVFSFDTQFLYQEGFKDGIAMLALRLNNDSVATRSTHFSSNSHYSLEISDNDRIGIKEIRGFLFLGKETRPASTSTIKLMIADYVQLLRIHIREASEMNNAPQDAKLSVSDSVRNSRRDSSATRDEKVQLKSAADLEYSR